ARAGRDDLARLAFQAIPGHLDEQLTAAPGGRRYRKTPALALTAQLQRAVSLTRYADLTSDTEAGAYAKRLLQTARTMLPRYDTGHWSFYSPGLAAPLRRVPLSVLLARRRRAARVPRLRHRPAQARAAAGRRPGLDGHAQALP